MYQHTERISSHWKDLAQKLNISFNYQKRLGEETSSDDKKLENILSKWIESESSPVTWSTLVKALQDINCNQTAREVKEFLKTPEAIKSYGKYTDHTPC